MIRGRYKLVQPQSPSQGTAPMLFDLEADPGELDDLAGEQPRIVERMLALLADHDLAGEVEPAVEIDDARIDEDLRRRLRALGYVD